MNYACTFDGHDLSGPFSIDYYMVRSLPTWEPNLVDLPARSGALFGGTRALPVEITMRLCTRAEERDQQQEALRMLAGWLAVEGPRPLYLGDEGGRYRMAVPSGSATIEPYLNACVVEVTFTCPDPRLFGDEVSVQVTTAATSVLVDGTSEAVPKIVGTATPNADGIWSIRDNVTGEYMQVSLTTGTSHAVVIDCSARTVTVDGATAMLAPACDWLTLEPGTHELQVYVGSGTAEVTWREAWW